MQSLPEVVPVSESAPLEEVLRLAQQHRVSVETLVYGPQPTLVGGGEISPFPLARSIRYKKMFISLKIGDSLKYCHEVKFMSCFLTKACFFYGISIFLTSAKTIF